VVGSVSLESKPRRTKGVCSREQSRRPLRRVGKGKIGVVEKKIGVRPGLTGRAEERNRGEHETTELVHGAGKGWGGSDGKKRREVKGERRGRTTGWACRRSIGSRERGVWWGTAQGKRAIGWDG